MKKILIISKSNLNRDPRVFKQIKYLKDEGNFIITVGKEPSGLEDVFYKMIIKNKIIIENYPVIIAIIKKVQRKFHKIKLKISKILKLYDYFYWNTPYILNTYKLVSKKLKDCDFIIANDIPVLPLAIKLSEKYNVKVLVDAHEYEPLHYNTEKFNSFFKDYWFYICKKYLPEADHIMTVCEGIAEEYSKNFGIECDVMMNLPFYEKLNPSERKDEKIRMVHHGAASRGRKIENMIELMKHLDERFELYFMILNMDTDYGLYLKKYSENEKRIKFIDPVLMPEIAKRINEFDMGLFLLEPNTFNHKMVLPNKLFEFIQARLALAIWPSQEMVKIIDKYKNGVYSKNFDISEMAGTLNSLKKADIIEMKNNSHKAAEELNSEKNRIQLLKVVEKLLI